MISFHGLGVLIYLLMLPFIISGKKEEQSTSDYAEDIGRYIIVAFFPIINYFLILIFIAFLYKDGWNHNNLVTYIKKLIKKIKQEEQIMNNPVISLAKGQGAGVTINLSKETGGSLQYIANLFWNAQPFGGQDTDLDIMAVVSGADGRILNNDGQNIVFYNNPTKMSADRAIQVSEDNLTGGTPGTIEPEEWCKLDFTKIDPNATKVDIIIDIHEAVARRQNFGLVSDGKCVIRDTQNNKDVIEYWFDAKGHDTGLVLCEFTKRGGEWVFKAKEQGYQGGLPTVLASYGITAQ